MKTMWLTTFKRKFKATQSQVNALEKLGFVTTGKSGFPSDSLRHRNVITLEVDEEDIQCWLEVEPSPSDYSFILEEVKKVKKREA